MRNDLLDHKSDNSRASVDASTSDDSVVICQAVRLGLLATRLRLEWHAGLVTADRAMKTFDEAMSAICIERSISRRD